MPFFCLHKHKQTQQETGVTLRSLFYSN